jgi:hypothetical protein
VENLLENSHTKDQEGNGRMIDLGKYVGQIGGGWNCFRIMSNGRLQYYWC